MGHCVAFMIGYSRTVRRHLRLSAWLGPLYYRPQTGSLIAELYEAAVRISGEHANFPAISKSLAARRSGMCLQIPHHEGGAHAGTRRFALSPGIG